MTALKNNIDHYMELKNIEKYSHLLADIARELGMKGREAYRYAGKEKSNFSKMLKNRIRKRSKQIAPILTAFSGCGTRI